MEEKSRQKIWMLISALSVLMILGVGALLLWPKLRGGDDAKWTVYTSDAGKFKAFFCGEIKINDITTGAGAVTNHSVFSGRPDGLNMGVTWADFPAAAFSKSKPEEMVDALCFAAANSGAPSGLVKGPRNGLYSCALEFNSSVDGSYNRQLVTVKGLRIYTVFGHGPQSPEIRRDMQQFFDSFVVIE